MDAYFIYNNLKVNTLMPGDAPLPGFNLLTYDQESWTTGTLWNLGEDAGFSHIGHHKVKGQLWTVERKADIEALESFSGVSSGLMEPVQIEVKIEAWNGEITETLQAVTFRLKELDPSYQVVTGGNWWIKRDGQL